MGFLSMWPLALLVLVGVIILLYILKQETNQRDFSSTILWQEMLRNNEATKPWEKLRKNILLILQIITVILIILALMGPWIKGLGKKDQCLVLVIDNSASMSSIYEDNVSRLEAAKEAAKDYVSQAPSGAQIYVISGNRQAVLEIANSTDTLEVKNRIDSISQTQLAGDLTSTLGLVSSCAAKAEDCDIVFFTDSAFDIGDMEAKVASFYSQGENLSLDGISYARDEDKLLVLSQLTNYSDKKLDREINLYGIDDQGKEKLLDIVEVSVNAQESTAVYAELPLDTLSYKVIKAEINEDDLLEGDNSSWCVLDQRQAGRVLLLTRSNMFIEKAFENLSGVEIFRTDDTSVVEGEEKYDLYIFDGILPSKLPETGNLLFINCQWPEYFSQSGKVEGKMLSFVDCDITTYVEDCKLGVNESYVYQVPDWGQSYVDSDEGSAGFYGPYDGRKIACMGFDLHQTDFGLQPEFPVFISNLSGFLLEAGLTDGTSFVCGESIMLHGSTRGSDLKLTSPDGSATGIPADQAMGTYLELNESGVYRAEQTVEDLDVQQYFIAQYPSTESVVESPQQMLDSSEKLMELTGTGGVLELRPYLIVLLLVLLMAEWLVYIRQQ